MDASGIGSCYRTQDGVGVKGGTADIGKRATGIPIALAIPGAIVIALVGALGVPLALSRFVRKYSEKSAVVPAVVAPVEMSAARPGGKPDIAPLEKSTVFDVPPVRSIERSEVFGPAVTVTGVTRMGMRVNVTLSDGRTLSEAEPYLRIERAFVESPLGVRYYFSRSIARASAPVVSPSVSPPAPNFPVSSGSPRNGEALFIGSEGFQTTAVTSGGGSSSNARSVPGNGPRS